MQRSKFDIGGADAGAGGMSISSGSGGASGMGASSSPSDASAMRAFEGAMEDGAGESGARLRLDAALEAVEDRPRRRAAKTTCFVAGGMRARCEGKRPAWRPGWPRWRGCWPCPKEGSTIVLLCLGSSRRPERASLKKKKLTSVISKKCPAREFIPITVLINSKKLKTALNYSHYCFNSFEKQLNLHHVFL